MLARSKWFGQANLSGLTNLQQPKVLKIPREFGTASLLLSEFNCIGFFPFFTT
jgi:hypothetical protein